MKRSETAKFGNMKTLLLALSILTIGCSDETIHHYAIEPPTEHANYLTYVEIIKTSRGDTIRNYRWEVLQFNPYHTSLPKWNTMHIPWDVDVLYWTELPSDPIGSSFEATSGTFGPPRRKVKFLNPILGDTLIVAEDNTIYIGNPYLAGDTIAEIIAEALIGEVKADCQKLEPKITIGSRGSITYEYDNPNGITIYFTQDKFYQTEENPAKGDIKIDTTAARIGSIVFVLHKDIKEPNYGRGVKIVGGKYDPKKVNYLVYTKLNGELSSLEITHVEDYN